MIWHDFTAQYTLDAYALLGKIGYLAAVFTPRAREGISMPRRRHRRRRRRLF